MKVNSSIAEHEPETSDPLSLSKPSHGIFLVQYPVSTERML